MSIATVTVIKTNLEDKLTYSNGNLLEPSDEVCPLHPQLNKVMMLDQQQAHEKMTHKAPTKSP